MKQILAFGDSNTWGLVPGTVERYPEHIRWTGILRKAVANLGFRILEDGVCGRTTVFQDPFRPGRRGIESIAQYRETGGIDAVILMLGTNDCKKSYRATPEQIGCGLEQCLIQFESLVRPDRILVISPILLGQNVWRPEKDPDFDKVSIETSIFLKAVYRQIAERRGNLFMAASDHAFACHVDEEHLNAEGHEQLAAAILKKLSDSGILVA
ncbi:MAG: arylesterase [Clostridia bacterium]|nr:arylesterase [Clostridia bacterium]